MNTSSYAKPVLYYVLLTPQEARSPKPVIAKFEAQGWTFLKRRISCANQKMELVFQRASLKWKTTALPSIFHPFRISQPK